MAHRTHKARRSEGPGQTHILSNDRNDATTDWAWLADDLSRDVYDPRLDSSSPEYVQRVPALVLDDDFPELDGLDAWRERTFGIRQGGRR